MTNLRASAKALRIEDFPRKISIQTRYADLDPQRHVNNAAIGTIMAEARSLIAHEVFQSVGRKKGYALMVGQFAMSYLGQVHYPEACEIGVGLIEAGDKFLRAGQGLFQQGRCLAIAESVMISTQDGAPAPLDPEVAGAWGKLAMAEGRFPRQLR